MEFTESHFCLINPFKGSEILQLQKKKKERKKENPPFGRGKGGKLSYSTPCLAFS